MKNIIITDDVYESYRAKHLELLKIGISKGIKELISKDLELIYEEDTKNEPI